MYTFRCIYICGMNGDVGYNGDQYHQQRHSNENKQRSGRCSSSVRFSKDLAKMQPAGTYEFFFRAKQVFITFWFNNSRHL